MIPLRDTVPSNTIPVVNYLLIGLNGVVFLFELSLGRHLDTFILHYGLVPARFLDHLHSEGLRAIMKAIAARAGGSVAAGEPGP